MRSRVTKEDSKEFQGFCRILGAIQRVPGGFRGSSGAFHRFLDHFVVWHIGFREISEYYRWCQKFGGGGGLYRVYEI